MADIPENLARFSISETSDGYLFDIEGDGGSKFVVNTTPDQLDALVDALDQLLSEDEAAADEVKSNDV